jgi:hypothetical protein
MSRVAPRVDVPGDGPRVLSSIRLADVLGSSPHGVVRLAHTQTIADALRTLSQYNILSAPGAPWPGQRLLSAEMPWRRHGGAARRPKAHACGSLRLRLRLQPAAQSCAPPRASSASVLVCAPDARARERFLERSLCALVILCAYAPWLTRG